MLIADNKKDVNIYKPILPEKGKHNSPYINKSPNTTQEITLNTQLLHNFLKTPPENFPPPKSNLHNYPKGKSCSSPTNTTITNHVINLSSTWPHVASEGVGGGGGENFPPPNKFHNIKSKYHCHTDYTEQPAVGGANNFTTTLAITNKIHPHQNL